MAENVAIVGAGIAGLSTAWALTKRGVSVTLFEQGPVPNPLSASGDEHRIIRRAYAGQGGYARRIDEAYDAWDEMFADIGANHLEERGFLLVSREPGDDADRYRDSLVEGGYPLDMLEGRAAIDRFPFLEAGSFRYAGFSPEGGALLCQRIAADLAAWLVRNGATVRDNTAVTGIDAAAGSLTTQSGEPEGFDRIIVTAGAWVVNLVPALADRLATYRTAVAYFTPPADLADAWRDAPVLLDLGGDSDGYGIPPMHGSGLKLGTANHKWKSGPDENRDPGADEADAIRKWFQPPLLRLDEYAHEKTVTCAYTFTVDEHFTMHRQDRMTVISACSGHGYKFGAAIGRRVADHLLADDGAGLAQWLEARD